MVKHECIPLDSPSKWRAALQGISHAFAHTWEHCYAMHLTTGLKTYLYCFEKDNVRIVCPFTERRFDGYVDIVKPFGFSGFVGNGDCPEFPYYWKEFAKQRTYICAYLGVNPIFENSTYFEQHEMYQYTSIYVLDLTLSSDKLYANLSKGRKAQLNKWNKILSNIVLDRSTVTDFFLYNYHDFMRSKNALSVYNFSRDTLSFLAGLDNVSIIGAQSSGKVVSVGFFTYTCDVADHYFNISLPEGRNHSAALVWYAVNYLKSLQIPILNLGGSYRENDGVAQFKQHFGSKKLPLKCIKQVFLPEIYEKLCRQVNVDPNDITGYFPPYRKP